MTTIITYHTICQNRVRTISICYLKIYTKCRKPKIFPVLLAVWPYTLFLGKWIQGTAVEVYLLATVLVVAANLAHVVYLKRKGDSHELAFWCRALKLAHIPYFLLLGLTLFALLFIIIVPTFVFLVPILAGILLSISYALLVTSAYGLAAIHQERRRNILSKLYTVGITVLHLIFVADVIGACLIYGKLKQDQRNEIEEISVN